MPRMAERIAASFAPRRPSSPEVSMRKLSSSGGSRIYYRGSVISVVRPSHSVVETTDVTEDDVTENDIIAIIQEANMDGVRHLRAGNTFTRTLWCTVIVIFVILALFQIYSQIVLYSKHPVATNIEAEYPNSIPFPVVAVCNNNQFRLTYITGARTMNRSPKYNPKPLKSRLNASASIFDTIIEKNWDVDAVRFLRLAAHWKSRMILDCTWPDGTKCHLTDFRAVWTTTGLCWAINTDQNKPVHVTGSGVGHGLRLLLNVENYERVDACTPHFRSKSLSGLKILIYNQTHVPESSLDGVNVPSGYSMGIPFRMQHRTKLPGVNCIDETDEHIAARDDFDSPLNVRTCAIRKYLTEIESECNCSMRRSFDIKNNDVLHQFFTKWDDNGRGRFRNRTLERDRMSSTTRVPPTTTPPPILSSGYLPCNVDDFFGCVQSVIARVQREGTNGECPPPCQVIDYVAWQDMNRMPRNIMPAVIEETEEEDETDVEQESLDEDRNRYMPSMNEETYTCADDAYLTEQQVLNIKRDAHRAYEKQSRYQEDIFLRTKRLILRLRNALNTMVKLKWGWQQSDFNGVYGRLSEKAKCFATFAERHEEIASIMKNRPPLSEERRAHQVHFLVDAESHARFPNRYKSIGDIKSHYGDKVDTVLHEIESVLTTIEKMWHLYEEKTYASHLTADLSRMDRIISLMTQYEHGQLQRRVWAEKMLSRQMRHFFDEEFHDGHYQIIMRDLDQTLRKTIHEVETADWPKLEEFLLNGTVIKTGAILFFEVPSDENQTKFRNFLMDVHNCTVTDVKNVTTKMLTEFKKAFRQLQAAYHNLFGKELPDFLENFEFGSKFISDNFAMVNVHLHQMYIERWSQDRTYTFWSLACDIGGALGLFLGASLLTIIELIYLFVQHGLCAESIKRAGKWFGDLKKPKKKRYNQRDTLNGSGYRSKQHELLRAKKNIWSPPHLEIAEQAESDIPDISEEHPPPYRHSQELSDLSDDEHFHPTNPLLTPFDPRDRLSEIAEENSNLSSDRLPPPVETIIEEANEEELQSPLLPPEEEELEPDLESQQLSSSADAPALFSKDAVERSTTV